MKFFRLIAGFALATTAVLAGQEAPEEKTTAPVIAMTPTATKSDQGFSLVISGRTNLPEKTILEVGASRRPLLQIQDQVYLPNRVSQRVMVGTNGQFVAIVPMAGDLSLPGRYTIEASFDPEQQIGNVTNALRTMKISMRTFSTEEIFALNNFLLLRTTLANDLEDFVAVADKVSSVAALLPEILGKEEQKPEEMKRLMKTVEEIAATSSLRRNRTLTPHARREIDLFVATLPCLGAGKTPPRDDEAKALELHNSKKQAEGKLHDILKEPNLYRSPELILQRFEEKIRLTFLIAFSLEIVDAVDQSAGRIISEADAKSGWASAYPAIKEELASLGQLLRALRKSSYQQEGATIFSHDDGEIIPLMISETGELLEAVNAKMKATASFETDETIGEIQKKIARRRDTAISRAKIRLEGIYPATTAPEPPPKPEEMKDLPEK